MSWLPSFLRAAPPAAAPPAAAPPSSPVTSEAVHGASLDLDHFSRDIAREFSRNLYIWRCVDAIAGLASSVPLKVVKTDDESQLTAAELDVERLLVRPNPQWSTPALMYFVATSIAVVSKAYLEDCTRYWQICGRLWPLGPDEVQVVYHENSTVDRLSGAQWWA